MSKPRDDYTNAFCLHDIFVVNGAMLHARPDQQEAWKRVRSKLALTAGIAATEPIDARKE